MQQTIYSITAQIKAINKAINEGKAANIWAAKNKVKTLKKQLSNTQRLTAFNNYLSQ